MKKIALTFCIFFISIGLTAQEAEAGLLRLDASVGMFSTKELYAGIEYDYSPWGRNTTPTYFVSTYFYRLKKMEVGLAFGYQKLTVQDDDAVSVPVTGQFVRDDIDLSFYTIMPQVRFNWVVSEDELFEMYSAFGFAVSIVNEDYVNDLRSDATFPWPGFNVTGLGIRFGGTFGGFMEIGMGNKGFMSGGISLRF